MTTSLANDELVFGVTHFRCIFAKLHTSRASRLLLKILAGMSRSVTVAVAYIMSVTNLSWKEALKVVRAGRAVANPNQGFQKQLQDFEQKMLAEERRRLKERYPSLALEASDRDNCAIMLDSYQSLLSARHICEGQCPMGQPCPTGVCRTGTGKRLFRRRSSSARPGPPATTSRLPASTSRSAGNSPATSSRQTHTSSSLTTISQQKQLIQQQLMQQQQQQPSTSNTSTRLLPKTPPCSSEPSSPRRQATGITRSASTMSNQRVRSNPSGLYSYTGTGSSAPPSRSGSRLDVSYTEGGGGGGGSAIVVGGTQWARHRAGSAPSTPLPSPPCSPQHWPRRNASLAKRSSAAT
ncbi:dual specificity protein phosphatase 15-like [Ctenocephalides felis]|uniref:dual specificity protein phosphatase 15-like n=1 Tax=Ctenocephalides felis TaxID=7515 RepID=UPI000E6E5501|nr:dual specificity protein phosphatase 15-like [Ctenocephalides felis]